MTDIQEEIDVLKSIYCKENEITIENIGPQELILSASHKPTNAKDFVVLSVSFGLLKYPSSCPIKLSVKGSCLSRGEAEYLRRSLLEEFQGKSRDSCMTIFEAVSCFHQTLDSMAIDVAVSEDVENFEPATTCVLHLDHMRDRQSYVKLLRKWSKELDLVGRIFFVTKIIIVLQGQKLSIKEFVQRVRTQKVDVDSRGRPCKERLLTILFNDVRSDGLIDTDNRDVISSGGVSFTSSRSDDVTTGGGEVISKSGDVRAYENFMVEDLPSVDCLLAKLQDVGLVKLTELLKFL